MYMYNTSASEASFTRYFPL